MVRWAERTFDSAESEKAYSRPSPTAFKQRGQQRYRLSLHFISIQSIVGKLKEIPLTVNLGIQELPKIYTTRLPHSCYLLVSSSKYYPLA